MTLLEIGRVCVKIAGREAGRYAVVVKKIDDNFVLITGPKALTGIKRRRCNVGHLEPTQYKIRIKEDASDKEVVEAMKKAGLIKKLGLKKPSEAELKGREEEKKVNKIPKTSKGVKRKKDSGK